MKNKLYTIFIHKSTRDQNGIVCPQSLIVLRFFLFFFLTLQKPSKFCYDQLNIPFLHLYWVYHSHYLEVFDSNLAILKRYSKNYGIVFQIAGKSHENQTWTAKVVQILLVSSSCNRYRCFHLQTEKRSFELKFSKT